MKIANLFFVCVYTFRHFERQIRSNKYRKDEQTPLHFTDQLNIHFDSDLPRTSGEFFHKGNAFNRYARLNHLMESFNIPGQRTKFY